MDKFDIGAYGRACRMVMDPDLYLAEIILKVRAVPGFIGISAWKNLLLGHEPLVPPHVHVEELCITLCLLLDCFRNSPAGMYAEPVEIPKKGPERTGLSKVAFRKCIDHLVMRGGIGKVQVERRVVVMVPAFHAAIPVPEIHAISPG
jgi:hypothetical protein